MLFFYSDSLAISSVLLPLLFVALSVFALLLDRLLGEPAQFHPLVGFGRWASWWEQRLNQGNGKLGIVIGALALAIVLSPLLLVVWLFALLADVSLVGWCLAQVAVLYLCIGWQSLQQHALAVWQASMAGDIDQARLKLSWIVSRDVAELDADEIAQADIESVLENSSDALFASLFWFFIGGAVFTLLHRWVNTLDAMWGYKNNRFLYFGKAAARLDDVLAYIPARLTALCFILVAGKHGMKAMACWRVQARDCASPNGGVVMTTGAGALNVRLSARACYHGVWKDKPAMGFGSPATPEDIPVSIILVSRACIFALSMWALVALAFALMSTL
ncbi:adenosylcobinamide-phosphate synthase CbiB [Thalassolituus oleivorans]|uniref:adenosylcobinamide-phosphate synthase CbiB n=1 Tax=Thalassolituus oleivorans TaxID=187493 RepID=UPI001CE2EE49|nr:adenosylcobinamide-phosphate synthase CbiB [Thalassolituus oleivorans]